MISRAHPYQREGIQFLAGLTHALLLMEMGLGKTRVALDAANEIEADELLVLCPPALQDHWREETGRWQPHLLPRLTVVPFSLCSTREFTPARRERRWPLVIIDELQCLKTPSSRRVKHCYGRGGLPDNSDRVWLLSGTPTPNGPQELFTHIKAFWPSLLQRPGRRPYSYWEWVQWLCYVQATTYGHRVLGVRKDRMEKLRKSLMPYVFARRKSQVLKSLPSLDIHTIRVKLSGVVEPTGAGVDALRAALDEGAVLSASEREHISTLRREHGIAKAPAIVKLLKDEFEAEMLDKVVVFCVHRQVMREIVAGLFKCRAARRIQQIHGDVPMGKRAHIVREFREDPTLKVLVCQIAASGVGLNMEVCSQVVMAEASFSPGENLQAIARCHRMTSKRNVTARFVGIANSIDDHVMRVLARKTNAITSTWGEATTAA